MIGWLLRAGDQLRHAARRRRWDPDRATGRHGEDLAHRFLQRLGFVVVARNYRTASGSGEIDLVAWEGETLVFVEVKSRATSEFGPPDRAVDADKQTFLKRAARDYTRVSGAAWERTRFDIVSIVYSDPPSIDLIRDAFR